MRWLVVALVLGTLAGGRPARADGGDAGEALRLRQASSEDWDAGRFRDAADKLRRAEAIYLRTPTTPALDLAVTRRALVWNLVKAGDLDGAAVVFEALRASAGAGPEVGEQMWNAYGAMYEGARAAGRLARAEAVLGAIREAAGPDDTTGLRTQVLHDLGSVALHAGDPTAAVRWYEQAIEERRKGGPSTGLAWSLNNLANLHLEQGSLDLGLAS
jgi:tetratricopeptide (TPR) repeat protein